MEKLIEKIKKIKELLNENLILKARLKELYEFSAVEWIEYNIRQAAENGEYPNDEYFIQELIKEKCLRRKLPIIDQNISDFIEDE